MSYPPPNPDASIARLSAQMEGLGREIGQLRRDSSEDLAAVRQTLTELRDQVRTTNGRVRKHDIELAEARAREEERGRVLSEVVARADRRWTRIAWAIGIALTGVIAGVGWLIALTT